MILPVKEIYKSKYEGEIPRIKFPSSCLYYEMSIENDIAFFELNLFEYLRTHQLLVLFFVVFGVVFVWGFAALFPISSEYLLLLVFVLFGVYFVAGYKLYFLYFLPSNLLLGNGILMKHSKNGSDKIFFQQGDIKEFFLVTDKISRGHRWHYEIQRYHCCGILADGSFYYFFSWDDDEGLATNVVSLLCKHLTPKQSSIVMIQDFNSPDELSDVPQFSGKMLLKVFSIFVALLILLAVGYIIFVKFFSF